MLSLIVDDGVADRGHRVAIYNPRFRVVGIASGAHSEYGPHTPSRDSSIAKEASPASSSWSASPAATAPDSTPHSFCGASPSGLCRLSV